MAQRRSETAAPGEDSFLDTIANLVGILIILVVIIGGKTRLAAEAVGREEISNEEVKQIEQSAAQMNELKSSVSRQEQELAQYDIELKYRQLERNKLLDRVGWIRSEIENLLSEKETPDRERIELEAELDDLQRLLAELEDQSSEVDQTQQTTIALQHLPTPMAKTVFDAELHLQLRGGRVAVIPWDRLVEQLKEDAPLAARRNASKEWIDDSLGPIDDFIMKYRLHAGRGLMSNGSRTAMGSFVELDRFELEPTRSDIGETLDQALSMGSRLRVELAGRSPQQTVITVWTYPDSFDAFRRLKEALFAEGFLTAARPLPENVRIGASPNGSRSAAQ